MTDHRDEHEAYAITPPPAVAEFQTRIAQLLADAQSKMSMALESSRLSEDEVRRLRARCDMEAAHIAELKAQIKTLRDERDEARRLVCRHTKKRYRTLREMAEGRGWDCFKEETK